MPTEHLRLRRCSDRYYRAYWTDEHGERRSQSFGRKRNTAQRRFATFHVRWKADPHIRTPSMEGPLTIRAAWEQYEPFADRHYRHPSGELTGEAVQMHYAMEPVLDLYGDAPAAEFGPKALKATRDRMVVDGLSLGVINHRVNRVRRVFKWLAAEELVPASVWHGLQAVDPLRPGRTEAEPTEPVQPVADDWVWAACKVLPPTLRAMVELQYWCGCRPGEVVVLRPADLNTTGKVWQYTPPRHKTAWRQKTRVILLGPKAQAAVRPFLKRDIQACCFSPREAQRQRWDACKTHRHQAVAEPKSKRRLSERYTTQSYGKAIAKACEKHDIPHWSPNQLRYNFGTRIRKEFGLEAAQLGLGHTRADVTQIYAERDLARALAIMEQVG